MRQKVIFGLFVFFLSAILYSGCDNCNCFCSAYDAEDLKLNDTIELRYMELYCNSEHEFRLSFDSLGNGRCPIGAYCIWEGNAHVDFIIKQEGRSEQTFTLNTHTNFLIDTVVNGIRFELIDMLPYPEVDKDYSLDDYLLHILVSD
jgi:hypothetical protein